MAGQPPAPPPASLRWHYCLAEPCEWLAIWIGPHRHLLKGDGTIGIVVERVQRQQDGTWIGRVRSA
jgi:hypothetical protein